MRSLRRVAVVAVARRIKRRDFLPSSTLSMIPAALYLSSTHLALQLASCKLLTASEECGARHNQGGGARNPSLVSQIAARLSLQVGRTCQVGQGLRTTTHVGLAQAE